jgi:polygalacturonase
VLIQDCSFHAGDDGIAIKSGLNEAGRTFGMPSENIRIENVTVEPEFDNGSTNGISIGSEMSGGVRNVSVDGLFVRRCAVGVYIKSMEGRGGYVEDIKFQNIVADQVLEPIRFAMDYAYRRRRNARYLLHQRRFDDSVLEDIEHNNDDDNDDWNSTIPYFRNLSVVNLVATRAVVAGTFAGLPDSDINGIELENVNITGSKLLQFRCSYVTNGAAFETVPEACF